MASALLVVAVVPSISIRADEPTARFYSQLRERQLFGLVEAECLRRLEGKSLSERDRSEMTLELSRTYAAHAWQTSGAEQEDLWQRARQVVSIALATSPKVTRSELLEVQLALLDLGQADWCLAQLELRPQDQQLRQSGVAAANSAIERLTPLEKSIGAQVRQGSTDAVPSNHPAAKNTGEVLTQFERRNLWQQIRFRIGTARLVQAKLSEAKFPDRAAALALADEWLLALVSGSHGDRLTLEAQLASIEVARLRDDFDRATKTLVTIEKSMSDETPRDLQERFAIERIQTWLENGKPTEAASWLIEHRRATNQRTTNSNEPLRQARSAELDHWQFEVELALWRIAHNRGDTKLAEELWQRLAAGVAELEQNGGDYWSARTKRVWSHETEIREYGHELAALIREVRQPSSSESSDQVLAKCDKAIAATSSSKQSKLWLELSDLRASVLFQAKRFNEAAAAFRELAESPRHHRSSATHLLWAISLGRQFELQPTDERRSEFLQTLVSLRQQFPNEPEASDAAWMLGQWNERQRKFTEAIELFASIPSQHRQRDDAWAAIARCHELRISEVREQSKSKVSSEIELALIQLTPIAEELTKAIPINERPMPRDTDDEIEPLPMPTVMMKRPQAELLVRLARLQLQREPADVKTADALLAIVVASSRHDEWRKIAKQLRIVSLAAQRKIDEAEGFLDSLEEAGADELLNLLDGLTAIAIRTDSSTQRLVAELQLRASEKLAKSSSEFSDAQLQRLWHARAEAFAATGQPSKAILTYQQLLEKSPKDTKLLRSAAELSESLESDAGYRQAKNFWRRYEALAKAGGADWLDARWHIIRCCQRLGERAEADKLLKVTKLLYPDLGDQEQRARFLALENK